MQDPAPSTTQITPPTTASIVYQDIDTDGETIDELSIENMTDEDDDGDVNMTGERPAFSLEGLYARQNNPFYSYKSELHFVLNAFLDGDDRLNSREVKKKIIELVRTVVKLANQNSSLKVPTLDAITNGWKSKNNELPSIPMDHFTKAISVRTTGTNDTRKRTVDLAMYKPSEILKFLNVNPRLSSKISALPEYVDDDDSRTSLTQGENWKSCRLFHHPMVTSSTGHTFWIEDFVNWRAIPGQLYRLSAFFLYHGKVKAKAHRAYSFNDSFINGQAT